MIPYQALFKSLAQAKIEYLVAGGVAVNLHQIQRSTMDLDLILHLSSKNVDAFVLAIHSLGFKAKLPINPAELSLPEKRHEWSKSNMIAFSFVNESNPFEIIDVLINEPKPFDELDLKKMEIEAFGVKIPVIGIDDLIELKEQAGREKDLFDAKQLRDLKLKTVYAS